jgi:hypothetical protein
MAGGQTLAALTSEGQTTEKAAGTMTAALTSEGQTLAALTSKEGLAAALTSSGRPLHVAGAHIIFAWRAPISRGGRPPLADC